MIFKLDKESLEIIKYFNVFDVSNHDSSPQNTRRLIRNAGLNQKNAAKVLGIGYSTMKKYVSSDGSTPYLVQFALESIINSNN